MLPSLHCSWNSHQYSTMKPLTDKINELFQLFLIFIILCNLTCSDAFVCQARTPCHNPCSGSQHGLASTGSGLPHAPPQPPMTHQNPETLQQRAAHHCTLTLAEIPIVQSRVIWVTNDHVSSNLGIHSTAKMSALCVNLWNTHKLRKKQLSDIYLSLG